MSSRIKIVSLPPHELLTDLDIRGTWMHKGLVGAVLLTRNEIKARDVYFVRSTDFVKTLRESGKKSLAEWWDGHFRDRETEHVLIPVNCCEEVIS